MAKTTVDLLGPKGGSGAVAKRLLTQGRLDPGRSRPFINPEDGETYVTVYMGGDAKKKESYKDIQVNTPGTLLPNEWKKIDSVLVPVANIRLVGINDLISRGLTYNLGNAMATMTLEWHTASSAMEAVVTMDGITRGKNDRPVFESNFLPIPIIHSDYEIGERELQASRMMGNDLDTYEAEQAVMRVAEQLESMLFTNTTYKYAGGTIFSYLNYTHRNLITLDSKWTNSGVTGKQMVEDVMAMKQMSITKKKYGPWILYIPQAYETLLDEDYSDAKGSNTIRERILKISNIMEVKVVDTLPDDNMVLVQMTADTVRLVRGMGITNMQWAVEGNFLNKFKILTIQVPQIRSDYDGNCGIVHATFAA